MFRFTSKNYRFFWPVPFFFIQLTPDDRIMVVLPFYYIYGKSLLNTHFYVGGSVVIDNRFSYPQVILESMKENGVTGFSGVPSTFMTLLNKSAVRKFTFESLRYVTQAGGAMAPSVQKEVARVFDPARLFIMYGATEASARLSYLDPDMLEKKWGSIGKAIPNVELFVADEKGNRLPPNQMGEIVARDNVERDEDLIRKFLARRLPSFKQPKYIVFTGSLPKNESGKVLKTVLKSGTHEPS